MTKIYHYAPEVKHYGGQILGARGIVADKLIKTEQKLGVGHNDQFDMDFVWLTQRSDQIPGACVNFIMGITMKHMTMHGGNPKVPNGAYFDNTPNTYIRWTFNADEIGAQPWPRARTKWVGISPSKKNFAREIDLKSIMNGDDVSEYWVCDKDIPISKAIATDYCKISDADFAKTLGYTTPQQVVDFGLDFMLKHRSKWCKKGGDVDLTENLLQAMGI